MKYFYLFHPEDDNTTDHGRQIQRAEKEVSSERSERKMDGLVEARPGERFVGFLKDFTVFCLGGEGGGYGKNSFLFFFGGGGRVWEKLIFIFFGGEGGYVFFFFFVGGVCLAVVVVANWGERFAGFWLLFFCDVSWCIFVPL